MPYVSVSPRPLQCKSFRSGCHAVGVGAWFWIAGTDLIYSITNNYIHGFVFYVFGIVVSSVVRIYLICLPTQLMAPPALQQPYNCLSARRVFLSYLGTFDLLLNPSHVKSRLTYIILGITVNGRPVVCKQCQKLGDGASKWEDAGLLKYMTSSITHIKRKFHSTTIK